MLTIDAGSAISRLLRMLERISDIEPAMSVIGARERLAAQRRIQALKADPDGVAWLPWATSTAAHRDKKGNAGQGLLWDDGSLLDSIVATSTDADVAIGVAADSPAAAYAGYLQDGTPRMPAREYLGWTDDSMRFAEDTVLNHIMGPL